MMIAGVVLLTLAGPIAIRAYTFPEQSNHYQISRINSSTSNVPTVTTNQPYTIGAWYFTAWSDLNDFQATDAGYTYGWRDPWGGVREYALGQDPWKIGGNYSSREPLIGFYDLVDQKTMDTHILQAASRGLSYFAFYWYWDKDKNRESNISTPIQKFVASPVKDKMKFLAAIAYVGRNNLTLDMYEKSLVPYLVSHYVADSSYVKTTDGRPIIVDFDTGAFTSESDHRAALDFLRTAVMAKTGKNPVILFIALEIHKTGDLQYAQEHLNLDGFMCFSFVPKVPAEPLKDTLSRVVPTLQNQSLPFYVPCTSVAVDARPWWNIGWGPWTEYKTINQRPYNTNITVQAFQDNLKDLKNYIDQNPSKTTKMLVIYAWNEWGEGGILEPSVVNKYRYLDSIQSVFGLTPVVPEPQLALDQAVLVNMTLPKSVDASHPATVSITMKNTGSTTWTKSAGYTLASQDPHNSTIWGLNKVNLAPTDSITPGQTKTFSFDVTALSFSGTYNLRWRMLQQSAGSFGDTTPTTPVNVASAVPEFPAASPVLFTGLFIVAAVMSLVKHKKLRLKT